jgi:hypothetical protein
MRTRSFATALLVVCLAVSAFCLVYPVYVIRPFRHQGAGELAAALEVLRWRPGVELVSCLLALWAAWVSWRCGGRWRRALTASGAVAVCAFAVLSRVNIYEQMFHPADRLAFDPVAQVKLDAGEMVIAVNLGGEARAYPIRSLSYHHIVNDVVAGRPITATY